MSRKRGGNQWARIWISRTELGREFDLSAVAVGKHLVELGLKDGRDASEVALSEGFAVSALLANGTPNYRWRKQRCVQVLVDVGLERLDIDEDIVNSRFELLVAQLAPDEVGAVPALRAEPSSYISPNEPTIEEALAASRAALFGMRVGNLERASDSWFDCAEIWMALGDRNRAAIALDYAAVACEAAGDHEQARAYRENLDTEELSSWAVARMGRPRPVFPPFLGDLL